MPEPMWSPDVSRIQRSNLAAFCKMAGKPVEDYSTLHSWSVDEPQAFWSAVWDFCDVVGDKGQAAFEHHEDIRKCRFFPEARLNYAENLLRPADDSVAIVFVGEDGRREEWTRKKLHAQVSRLQQALRAAGIGRGDRVAGFVPNMAETVAAMLATLSLGAVWSSCSPDFGAAAVEDRFGQIEPKLLFAASGYFYNGKAIDSRPVLADVAKRIPGIQKIVVWDYAAGNSDLSGIRAAETLEKFVAPFEAEAVEFERVGMDAPGFILFSSGTTGKPKCIVHSAGGLALQHMKEQRLHTDLKAGDRFFYFTTCGWMMWNWLVSGLASDATLILYDGNPFYPDGNRLVDLARDEKIDVFGTSAKYIDACSKAGVAPLDTHGGLAFRSMLSTGSPLLHESFDYIYGKWGTDVHLASISGGTDICGCFIGGVSTLPVYRGEIQGKLLGMDVAVFDEAGAPVKGAPGELVCRNAHPTLPLGFWNDPGDELYTASYFADYPNVWRHGDWLTETETGGFVVAGRSDATLNPGGVRIGTAEIYRQVERIPDVVEALVIGQDWEGDQRVVLFVKLRDGATLDETLAAKIKSEIRQNASPRHMPARIVAVGDIPRTKSGKIVELAVREIVHGRPVKNISALANPESLELFRGLAELQT